MTLLLIFSVLNLLATCFLVFLLWVKPVELPPIQTPTKCSDTTPPPMPSEQFPFRVVRRRGRPRKAPSPDDIDASIKEIASVSVI